jgi:aryl-alcohol dehydrogenase-like predicted oxidoreductase
MNRIETIELAPSYQASRIIRGGWQLAGGHGPVDRAAAIEDLTAAFDGGIFTFDCADIYTGVEALIGEFRRKLGDRRGLDAARTVKVHTKLVPDLDTLSRLKKAHVRTIVERSLRNLGQDRLDLVQLHWWDYSLGDFVDAFGWLDDLRQDGLIHLVGATNFDRQHLQRVIAAGLAPTTLQIQYSILDHRPENGLVALCQEHRIKLLCYGTVAGGFLSDQWLGAAAPSGPLENRSLVKYKLIVDEFGGWDLFQALLRVLRSVAVRHQTDIATIASRYVLERPGVACVIIGARNRAHVDANAGLTALNLDEADQADVAAILSKRQGPSGDVYELERDRRGKHGAIMKYNLNAVAL